MRANAIRAPNHFSSKPLFGKLDKGVTDQYKHLGWINAGLHKYDQEVEARVRHAQATDKAFMKKVFGNKGFQPNKD